MKLIFHSRPFAVGNAVMQAISTGIFGFPIGRAARIAVDTCQDSPPEITFCCFSLHDLGVYQWHPH